MKKRVITKEQWKEVPDLAGGVKVSNKGRIWTSKLGRVRPIHLNRDGYPYIVFTKNKKPKGYTVHRLVAEAFVPNPKGFRDVKHIDGDFTNNHFTNLEWYNDDKKRHGEANGKHVLSEQIVREMRKLAGTHSYGELARKYGVAVSTVSRIVRRLMWSHI